MTEAELIIFDRVYLHYVEQGTPPTRASILAKDVVLERRRSIAALILTPRPTT